MSAANESQAVTVHAVLTLRAGFAREDAPSAQLLGAYTQEPVARLVARCLHGEVVPVVLDQVPAGVYGIARELGLALPEGLPASPADARR